METLAPASAFDRAGLAAWYGRNRERSAQLFGLVSPSAYYSRPIALRHPFAFYEGHLPTFSFLTLNERSLHEAPIDPKLEKLFERGIDPGSIDAARAHERADWPSREEIEAFGRACDERVYAAFANAQLVDDSPRLTRGQAAFTILEHEQMHHETLVYIIHRLDAGQKGRIAQSHHDNAVPHNDFIDIPRGTATLGASRERAVFGWDNEFQTNEVDVPAFSVQKFPVTNGEYREFVDAGGEVPPFWIERDGECYLLGVFETLPLPLSWPVYVTHDQAEAYARWKGLRLPTEAEYHRAGFGTPQGDERAYPWGDESPQPHHGNFDFQRFDPEPVDAHPAGVSAWGVWDLVGNGWDWTSTPFGPFPGFEPMASYPQYSVDFFDGKHYVMKGGSPVTGRELVRRSFRNWFYGDYKYMYAKFRCAK
jgi:formylglycine-generating enzyme required for sulfatase activity